MKKVFKKTVAILALLGMVSCSAMAADPIEVYKDDSTVTVKVTSLESGEETSLLVTKGNATISEAFSDTTKVQHIDQVAADADGVSTFTFTYSGDGSLTVYSGYATMASTADPYKIVVDESTPPLTGNDYTLGDVNGDEKINVSDATAIVQYILNRTPFYNADGSEVYEKGLEAANVNKDTAVNVSDATSIVQYILNRTPFPEGN